MASLRTLGSVVAAIALASCGIGTITDAGGPSIWEGQIEPLGTSQITGSAAAVTQLGRTEMGIGIEGANPGASYLWQFRAGSCEDPGSPFGAATSYPTLVADEFGTASAEVITSRILQRGASYHARVLHSDEVLVACGDLVERR